MTAIPYPRARAGVRIGLVGADRTLAIVCQRALAHLGEVVTVPPTLDVHDTSVVVLVITPASDDSVRALARIRASSPRVRLIVLSTGVSADVAVELVKCGAEDYLELPCDPNALARKVERALTGSSRPTLDAPLVSAFSTGGTAFGNRRRTFRARVPANYSARVHVSVAGRIEILDLVDISLAADDQLGGMAWRADARVAAGLPLDSWSRGTTLAANIELPGHAVLIPADVILVRMTLGLSGPAATPIAIGVQYALCNAEEDRVIRTFWMECQRRMAGPVRGPNQVEDCERITRPARRARG